MRRKPPTESTLTLRGRRHQELAVSTAVSDIPVLLAGLTYTEVAVGWEHTVLLRSDGTAVACGGNDDGQCSLPALTDGLTYIDVAAGAKHTVLLKSDGTAVDCGSNSMGQCSIPPLNDSLTYTSVDAGLWHTVLLRSDGSAIASDGATSALLLVEGFAGGSARAIPALPDGLTYTPSLLETKPLQVMFDGALVRCLSLAGQECCAIAAGPNTLVADIYGQLVADHLAGSLLPGSPAGRFVAVERRGRLLSSASAEETAAMFFQ